MSQNHTYVALQPIVEAVFSHYLPGGAPIFDYVQRWKPLGLIHAADAHEALQIAAENTSGLSRVGISVTPFDEWKKVQHEQTPSQHGGQQPRTAARSHGNSHGDSQQRAGFAGAAARLYPKRVR